MSETNRNRIYGVVVGLVSDVTDPDGLARVKVKFPWLDDETESSPAPIAAFMAGDKRGAYFMPEVGDEVLVAFEHGDPSYPYIIGFLWNGASRPPDTNVNRRMFRSVNGHQIEFYDAKEQDGDKGYLRITDAHGNIIEMGNAAIRIKGVGTISIEAPHVFINNRRVTLTSGDI
jgi:uncharacterized protein involved in type VI secretion and phage assembly